jgi:uncharacterized protein (DUF433 family)
MTTMTEVVSVDPEILGGTPVFIGTRVPIKSLFDYIEAGEPLDEFLRQFPSVNRTQAISALELARDALVLEFISIMTYYSSTIFRIFGQQRRPICQDQVRTPFCWPQENARTLSPGLGNIRRRIIR